jgi:threonine dehydrogenase-like Zn-dependent dehydrogenase
MRALAYRGQQQLRSDYHQPVAPPGEALVWVRRAGSRGTEVETTRGYMSFQGVLGHELAGVADQCETLSPVGQQGVGQTNCCCGTRLPGRPSACFRFGPGVW